MTTCYGKIGQSILAQAARFAALTMVATVGFLALCQLAVAQEQGEPVAIGFNAPLSGPVAGWALPGLTGIKIWAAGVNAKGGLLVNGKRHKVVLQQFDNEYVPNKALQGARQLVLENNVKIVLGVGGSTGDAQIPFLTQHKVFYAPLSTTDINPDRPYVVAGFDYFPRGEMMRPLYMRGIYPHMTRYAVISQEDATAKVGQAWEVGAAKAAGWDVVYDKHFAADTTDFAAVVTAMLATKPDVVNLNVTWPEYIPLIMKQLYQQGFNGPIAMNYIEWSTTLLHIPEEWANKIHGYDSYPRMDDPWWGTPSAQSEFLASWNARFGPGAPEATGQPITGIDWLYVPPLQVWAYGVEKAGTFDADAVIKAIREATAIQTLEGPAIISGEDMWGIKNMMSAPVPTNRFDASCKCKRIVEMKRFEPWFRAHKDEIIGVVKEKGQMWNQRK